jgi:stage III sporulation protein AB
MKILGLVLVCGASTLLGVYFGSLSSLRLLELEEWKKALLMLKSEISFSSAPLPEAMKNIGQRVQNPVGKIFSSFSQILESREKADLSLIWDKAMSKWKKDSHLTQEDSNWLGNFGRTLGYLDKSMQLGAIDLTVGYITGQTEVLAVQSAKTKKMYRSLGVLCGLLIAVILL